MVMFFDGFTSTTGLWSGKKNLGDNFIMPNSNTGIIANWVDGISFPNSVFADRWTQVSDYNTFQTQQESRFLLVKNIVNSTTDTRSVNQKHYTIGSSSGANYLTTIVPLSDTCLFLIPMNSYFARIDTTDNWVTGTITRYSQSIGYISSGFLVNPTTIMGCYHETSGGSFLRIMTNDNWNTISSVTNFGGTMSMEDVLLANPTTVLGYDFNGMNVVGASTRLARSYSADSTWSTANASIILTNTGGGDPKMFKLLPNSNGNMLCGASVNYTSTHLEFMKTTDNWTTATEGYTGITASSSGVGFSSFVYRQGKIIAFPCSASATTVDVITPNSDNSSFSKNTINITGVTSMDCRGMSMLLADGSVVVGSYRGAGALKLHRCVFNDSLTTCTVTLEADNISQTQRGYDIQDFYLLPNGKVFIGCDNNGVGVVYQPFLDIVHNKLVLESNYRNSPYVWK